MKKGFYMRLAANGMKKNKKLYLPFLLTCVGMIMLHYIICFLATNPVVGSMKGGSTVQVVLFLGCNVITIFGIVFLGFSNSFLMQRRKKEFGLYNILGMEKKNIYRLLFCENAIIFVITMVIGLFCGILFSKFAELILMKIMNCPVNSDLYVSGKCILISVITFFIVFIFLYFCTRRQIRKQDAIRLFADARVGETAPKANYLFGILGLVLLAIAYFIAVTTKNPLNALTIFFFAVALVIEGTNLLMVFGSVTCCKILQKKKGYYYKKEHFVSVSTMAFRMKRNGSGLAIICILSTMVIVMMSSVSSLYIGREECMRAECPKKVMFYEKFQAGEVESAESLEKQLGILKEKAEKSLNDLGAEPKDAVYLYEMSGMALWNTADCAISLSNSFRNAKKQKVVLFIYPMSYYNRLTGENEVLGDNEVLLAAYRTECKKSEVTFDNGIAFQIKRQVPDVPDVLYHGKDISPVICVFMNDITKVINLQNADFETDMRYELIYGTDNDSFSEEKVQACVKAYGERARSLNEQIRNDSTVSEADKFYRDEDLDEDEAIREYLNNVFEGDEFSSAFVNLWSMQENEFFGLYGGLFFLGILLSILFIVFTVLVIYYKQICEGFEDRGNFEIMQKVGMTKEEIGRSVRSQMLTVFFVPLLGAGLHMVFAFFIINRILRVFYLFNTPLFIMTTLVTFLTFCVFYIIIYRLTSKEYYKIVSGAEQN